MSRTASPPCCHLNLGSSTLSGAKFELRNLCRRSEFWDLGLTQPLISGVLSYLQGTAKEPGASAKSPSQT